MAQLLARASALPGIAPVLPPSPFRHLVRHAAERPDAVARMTVSEAGAWEAQTWAELRVEVERLAAGLVRRGLRSDQVVVSLVQDEGRAGVVELAVRAVGAVPVRLTPEVHPDQVAQVLDGPDVRLVIADAETDLAQLGGARLPHAESIVLGGDGWLTQQRYGAERLVMDPDAVTRTEAMVSPADTMPRWIDASSREARIEADPSARGAVSECLAPDDVVLFAGSPHDPFLSQLREIQLSAGAVTVQVRAGADLGAVLVAVRPTVVAVDVPTAALLEEQFWASFAHEQWAVNLDRALEALDDDGAQDPRVRRAFRLQVRNLAQARPWWGGRLTKVLCPRPTPQLRRATRVLKIEVPDVVVPERVGASLPALAPVERGDASTLTRRERAVLPSAFTLAVVAPRALPAAGTASRTAAARTPAVRTPRLIEHQPTCLDELLARRAAGAGR